MFITTVQTRKWAKFASDVGNHILKYVIPQYGDEGAEPATEYTFDDCIKQAQRYLARAGRSSRPGEEKRDMLKAAHWIQKAYDRL